MDAAVIEAFERWRRADRVVSDLPDGVAETPEHAEAHIELEHAKGDFLRLIDDEANAPVVTTKEAALASMRAATTTLLGIARG